MIDRKKLMVGDLIYNHRQEVCPVVEIGLDTVTVKTRLYDDVQYKYDDVYPIPLTDDILKKNGFADNSLNVWFFPELSCNLYLYKEGDKLLFDIGDGSIDVCDVQTLQHIYQLFNLSKNIVI
jgi:hypothetical protein